MRGMPCNCDAVPGVATYPDGPPQRHESATIIPRSVRPARAPRPGSPGRWGDARPQLRSLPPRPRRARRLDVAIPRPIGPSQSSSACCAGRFPRISGSDPPHHAGETVAQSRRRSRRPARSILTTSTSSSGRARGLGRSCGVASASSSVISPDFPSDHDGVVRRELLKVAVTQQYASSRRRER